MILYIDGNDVIETLRHMRDPIFVPGDRMKSRHYLTRWLARYAELQGCDVICIFDENPVGQPLPPTERYGRVRVVNLEPGADVFHEIAGPANRAAHGQETIVVSDDVRLMRALQRGKAHLTPAADFVERIKTQMRGEEAEKADEPDEKFSGLSRQEVDTWLDFFKDKKRGGTP